MLANRGALKPSTRGGTGVSQRGYTYQTEWVQKPKCNVCDASGLIKGYLNHWETFWKLWFLDPRCREPETEGGS